MPLNVIGKSSNKSENKMDTSLFVQKPYLRINYLVSNIEEDFYMKNQLRIKNSSDPISIREPAAKHYIDNKYNDPSIKKETPHKFTSMIKNSNTTNIMPAISRHLNTLLTMLFLIV